MRVTTHEHLMVLLDSLYSDGNDRTSSDAAAFWDALFQQKDHPLNSDLPDASLVAWHTEGLLGDQPGRTALDIGCGLGRNSRWLAAQEFTTTGIDIAPDALERAAGRSRGTASRTCGGTSYAPVPRGCGSTSSTTRGAFTTSPHTDGSPTCGRSGRPSRPVGCSASAPSRRAGWEPAPPTPTCSARGNSAAGSATRSTSCGRCSLGSRRSTPGRCPRRCPVESLCSHRTSSTWRCSADPPET